MNEIIKIIFSVVASIFTVIMGGWDIAAQILLILMIIDYVTGIIRSARKGELSSNTGFRGITKKILMLTVVGVAVLLDRGMNVGGALRGIAIWYYIANEALSVVENIGEMGVAIPKKLRQTIESLRKENDEGETFGDKAN